MNRCKIQLRENDFDIADRKSNPHKYVSEGLFEWRPLCVRVGLGQVRMRFEDRIVDLKIAVSPPTGIVNLRDIDFRYCGVCL